MNEFTLKRAATLAVALGMVVGGACAQEAPSEAPVVAEPAPVGAVFNAPGSKMVSISYGYVMTEYEEADNTAEGWRINGTFEMRKTESPVVHGLTVGYMETEADRTVGNQTVTYDAKTIPLYYAPKIIFGKNAVKGFVKGALGCHFTDYGRTGAAGGDISSDEFGFYGGGGLGAMLVLKEKYFINAEYEIVYMSNSYYRDGVVQSAMLGVGLQL